MPRKQAKESALFWLKRLGVEEYAGKKLETLSKGNQQKVQLAQTIVCNPEIVILDEPFSGLDPVNSQILKEVIQELIEQEKIVIFSSHQMSYVEEFCDDIVIINKGEVVLKGELKEIKKEFGRDQLAFSVVGQSGEELARFCKEQFASLFAITQVKKDYIVIRMEQGVKKNQILQALLDHKLDIQRFGIYEPSLTDIFVEKAGD